VQDKGGLPACSYSSIIDAPVEPQSTSPRQAA
jgi:hypothetical protein